jgi:hypothetical protein
MEYSRHSKCNVKLTKFTLWTHVSCVKEETLKHQKTTFLSEGTSQASGMSCNQENCLLSLLLSFLSDFVEFCIHLTLCKLPSIYGEVGPPHLCMQHAKHRAPEISPFPFRRFCLQSSDQDQKEMFFSILTKIFQNSK